MLKAQNTKHLLCIDVEFFQGIVFSPVRVPVAHNRDKAIVCNSFVTIEQKLTPVISEGTFFASPAGAGVQVGQCLLVRELRDITRLG